MDANFKSLETDGLSLFNPVVSIQLGNANAKEEEEEENDRIRRHNELAKVLETEFNDIEIDDDNNTLNDSNYNSSHISHGTGDQLNNKHNYINDKFMKNNEENYLDKINTLQLELDYSEERLIKVQQTYEEERKEHIREINDLKKKLTIAEADYSHSNMTRDTNKELLVESKTQISRLKDENSQLNVNIKQLQDLNSELTKNLDHTKIMLHDAEMKYTMLQKNANMNRRAEAMLDKSNEKNCAQVELMQSQINNYQTKYEALEHAHKNLETRYSNLELSRQSLLKEKTEMINDLEAKLRETQIHYHELLGNSHHKEDYIKIQKLNEALEVQAEDMQKTITNLREKLDSTTAELNSVFTLMNYNEESECVNGTFKTPNRGTPKTLKNELYQSFNRQKMYKDDITKLNEQISVRDNEIKRLKNDENDALVKINKLKEDHVRLVSKLNITESELTAIKIRYNHNDNANDEQLDEIKNLKSENEDFRSRINFLENEYESRQRLEIDLEKQKFLLKDSHAECERVNKLYAELLIFKENLVHQTDEKIKNQLDKIIKLENEIETLTKNHETEMKALNNKSENEKLEFLENNKYLTNVCSQCRCYLDELNELKKAKFQSEKALAEYSAEMDEIRNDLNIAHKSIEELNNKLGLKEENDQLINELKAKALEFQEFMKNHSNASLKDVSTSPQRIESKSQSCSTSPDFKERSNRDLEKKIKEEMSRTYAAQIIALEDKFKIELIKFQENVKLLKIEIESKHNEIIRLNKIVDSKTTDIENVQEELASRLSELQIRSKEVDLLKYAIMSERNKTAEMAVQKENETKFIFANQNEMLKKCRDELEMCQTSIVNLKEELKENQEQMNNERNSMKMVLKQLADERKKERDRETELIEKISELHDEHTREVEQLRDKYNSAKKTAANYKKYAEDKEQHMAKEFERLKTGYESALNKVQSKMKQTLESQEKNINEKMKNIERDFQQKSSSYFDKQNYHS